VSHYRLLNPLGSGGMGVVYRAEDTALGRTVALKFLSSQIVNDPKRVERFREEARTASSLNHPNICTIYEVGEQEGELFIAMEYVEGRPLSEFLRDGGMAVETLLRYGRQISGALEHAHERGIVHRDLKPANVVVTPKGTAKILDFGLAKRADPEQLQKTTQGVATETTVGLTGTLPYMSPEQLQGGETGPQSDMWSLGVMLYEMATGTRPFRGENLYRLCTAIIQEPMPLLPENVPVGLAAVIKRCLQKEPERRYQRASELRAALETLEISGSGPSVPVRPEKAETTGKPLLWIALAVALVLVGGVGIGLRWHDSKAPNSSGNAGISVPKRAQLAILPPSGGSESEDAAFNEGLVETLTSRLTALTEKHPLAVIPASEVRAHKVGSVDAARAEFGINLGLVINVQHAGGQERVNYSLVDANSHQQLRGGTITAPRGDPFALQDKVSASVTQALELELQPQEKRALQAYGTTEPAAYDFYLQGRGYLQDYVKLENVENAIKVFNNALKKDPGFAAANAGLGEAYWRKYQLTHDQKWANAAIENCQKGVARDSRLAAAHVCLGRVFAGTGSYQKALEEYSQAIDLEPTNDAAHPALAYSYEQLGQLDAAEKTFKQAIAVRPNYWATYNWLGLFYQRHARYEDAMAMYSQVVSLAPDSFTGYYNLGGVRTLQGRYAEAIPLLQRSLEIRRTADATSNLGTAYFQLHRYADSAAAFEESTQLDSKNYLIWGNLGDAYYWAPNRREEAAAAYGKGIALGEEKLRVNPRDAEVLGSLAMYHAMRGERRPALQNLDAALGLNPKSPDLLFNAGIVYQQLGDTQRALDALEKAVAAGISPATLRDTPNFDGLRANPRFLKLIQR
jgi:serine/threonine protein kinase/tetratricopeptide (TPR) repeat protein